MKDLATTKDRPRAAPAPVASVSRREAVVAQIRRGIVVGALRPGDKLTELALAADLHVSRATVREALGQLDREGLVVSEPYRGLRVADLDAAALRDLARTRVALDDLAAGSILADPTGGRLDAVRDAWVAFEATAFDADAAVRHDGHLAFHRAIWSAAENVVLDQLWPVIQAHLTIALAQDQAVRHDPERSHRLHRALVDALESGDEARVAVTFREHTLTSADELIALRERHEATPGRGGATTSARNAAHGRTTA